MTDIDQMDAKQLYTEIVRVLGVTFDEYGHASKKTAYPLREIVMDTFCDECRTVIEVWNPTENIADAWWWLVEDAHAGGYDLILKYYLDGCHAYFILGEFSDYEPAGFHGQATFAPLAICRAWLKWKQADNHGQE